MAASTHHRIRTGLLLVLGLLAFAAFACYGWWRLDRTLIHRYSTGYGHVIDLGESHFDPTVLLLPETEWRPAMEAHEKAQERILWITWPFRQAEASVHGLLDALGIRRFPI